MAAAKPVHTRPATPKAPAKVTSGPDMDALMSDANEELDTAAPDVASERSEIEELKAMVAALSAKLDAGVHNSGEPAEIKRTTRTTLEDGTIKVDH